MPEFDTRLRLRDFFRHPDPLDQFQKQHPSEARFCGGLNVSIKKSLGDISLILPRPLFHPAEVFICDPMVNDILFKCK
jgi:hypothetical protein